MNYKNARDILPETLLTELQNYVEGQCIYIPKREENHKKWGELNDAKRKTARRNHRIYQDYQSGTPIDVLADKYYLSAKSIQKIISVCKK